MNKEHVSNKTLLWIFGSLVSIFILVALVYAYQAGKEQSLLCKGKEVRLINRRFYKLCFNKATKQPNWVLQFVVKDLFDNEPNEFPEDYYPDIDIPKKDQASEVDYKESKYVMSTFLFPFPKHSESIEGYRYQRFFSVTSPQNSAFHRVYWRKLRNRVKDLLSIEDRNKAIVLSGPLFFTREKDVENRLIGPGKIPIPSHFFQVIAPSLNVNDMEAYIVPNQKLAEDIPLVNFKVGLKEFEKKSGIKGIESIADYFFPSMWQVVP